jgi:uncharacterized FlaG/YvyC family protein
MSCSQKWHATCVVLGERKDEYMSNDWTDIQSFFRNQSVLKAINDLSIAIKHNLAGVHHTQGIKSIQQAKQTIKEFLLELNNMLSERKKGIVFGIDSHSNDFIVNFINARKDTKNFSSVLIKCGPESTLSLLETNEPQYQKELIKSLSELRKIISKHQNESASMIFEEF